MTRQRTNLLARFARHLIITNTGVTRRVTSNLTRQRVLSLKRHLSTAQSHTLAQFKKVLLRARAVRFHLPFVLNLLHHAHPRRLLLNRRRNAPLHQHRVARPNHAQLRLLSKSTDHFRPLTHSNRHFRRALLSCHPDTSAIFGATNNNLFLRVSYRVTRSLRGTRCNATASLLTPAHRVGLINNRKQRTIETCNN